MPPRRSGVQAVRVAQNRTELYDKAAAAAHEAARIVAAAGLPAPLVPRFVAFACAYAEHTARWNATVRLVGDASPRAVIVDHLLDAALAAEAFAAAVEPPPGPLLDVGTGGGMPGLWWAVRFARPAVLLDARERKALLAAEAARAVGAADVTGVHGRLTDDPQRPIEVLSGPPLPYERFGIVTARAVFSHHAWLPAARAAAPCGVVVRFAGDEIPPSDVHPAVVPVYTAPGLRAARRLEVFRTTAAE